MPIKLRTTTEQIVDRMQKSVSEMDKISANNISKEFAIRRERNNSYLKRWVKTIFKRVK